MKTQRVQKDSKSKDRKRLKVESQICKELLLPTNNKITTRSIKRGETGIDCFMDVDP